MELAQSFLLERQRISQVIRVHRMNRRRLGLPKAHALSGGAYRQFSPGQETATVDAPRAQFWHHSVEIDDRNAEAGALPSGVVGDARMSPTKRLVLQSLPHAFVPPLSFADRTLAPRFRTAG
jgi:hypothetical protein